MSLSATNLAAQVRKADRRHERLMLGLAAPTIGFIVVFFALPLALFLFRSVDNPEVHARCRARSPPWRSGTAARCRTRRRSRRCSPT